MSLKRRVERLERPLTMAELAVGTALKHREDGNFTDEDIAYIKRFSGFLDPDLKGKRRHQAVGMLLGLVERGGCA